MAVDHISDDDLELLAFDRLPESAAAPAEEHLLTCAECRERSAGWDEWVGAIRAAMLSVSQTTLPWEWKIMLSQA